jgi:hypothetical protein
MARRYRLTPKRRAALRKAQLASARARRGAGKARTKYKNASPRRKKMVKYAGVTAAAVGAGALVYGNRENLIIKHVAVHRAVKDHRRNAANLKIKLTPADYKYIKAQERIDHANRSTLRVREYREARRVAKASFARGRSLRPDRKNSVWSQGMSVTGVPNAKQNYYYETYRKDVYSRAVARHSRMKGKKRGFNYNSGKRLTVYAGGRVKRERW